jgi:hemerythrin
MEAFDWKKEYSVGNKNIDAEHQKLLLLSRKIINLETTTENKKQKLSSALKELMNYVKTHFKNEEDYMARIGYPDLESHAKVHKTITDNLIKTITANKSADALIKQLEGLLEKWIIKHIFDEDKKYQEWMKNQ